MRSRRIRTYRASTWAIANAIRTGVAHTVLDGIPITANVEDVRYDAERDMILITCTDESFEDVPLYYAHPKHDVTIKSEMVRCECQ